MTSTHVIMTVSFPTKDNLHTEIVAAKFDLLKWIIMALIAQGGLVVALVKLL